MGAFDRFVDFRRGAEVVGRNNEILQA